MGFTGKWRFATKWESLRRSRIPAWLLKLERPEVHRIIRIGREPFSCVGRPSCGHHTYAGSPKGRRPIKGTRSWHDSTNSFDSASREPDSTAAILSPVQQSEY